MTRPADLDDLPVIVSLKLRMFDEAGLRYLLADDAEERVLACYRALYANAAAQHFVVEQEDRIVACSGAFLKDDPPFCFFRRPVYGFIGDVYTDPDHRRRGYARQLTLEAMNWLRSRGVEMIRLLTTDEAQRLYAALGFQPSDEMVLRFSVEDT